MSNLFRKTTPAVIVLLALSAIAAGQGRRERASAGSKPSADAGAQASADEVERLLVRHVLAEGGAAVFKVRTRIVRGRVELSTSPLPGRFESYQKAPDMEMSIINAPVGQFISATYGVSRWRQAPWGAATSVGLGGGGESFLSEAAKSKGDFKFRSIFSASRLKGRARVDGREMIVLAATPKGLDKPLLMYFDAETYLLRKQEPDRAGGGWGETTLKAIYIDSYATVDGVKVPALFRVETRDFTLTFRATEVKHNVRIDDRLFASPEGK